jgi:hypothetical protein
MVHKYALYNRLGTKIEYEKSQSAVCVNQQQKQRYLLSSHQRSSGRAGAQSHSSLARVQTISKHLRFVLLAALPLLGTGKRPRGQPRPVAVARRPRSRHPLQTGSLQK